MNRRVNRNQKNITVISNRNRIRYTGKNKSVNNNQQKTQPIEQQIICKHPQGNNYKNEYQKYYADKNILNVVPIVEQTYEEKKCIKFENNTNQDIDKLKHDIEYYHTKIDKLNDKINLIENNKFKEYDRLFSKIKQRDLNALKDNFKSNILNQTLNIKDMCLNDINVKIITSGQYWKFILSHQGKIKISGLDGIVLVGGLEHIETLTGNIDLLNFQNKNIYRGIIHCYNGQIKYTLASRPIVPINIEFDASINIEMNIINAPK